MKTPEEIKRSLECSAAQVDGRCEEYVACVCCPLFVEGVGMEDIADYIQQLEAQVPKWISVDDPPKKGGRYLILFEDGHCCDAEFDEDIDFDSQFGEWVEIYHPETLGYLDSEWRGYQEVTHWMPLPSIPEEEK